MNYCLLPWLHQFINTDGKVYPCCKLAGVEKFVLGDVNQQSLREIWADLPMKNMRKDFKEQNYPKECYMQCFNNSNPLNVFISNTYKQNKQNIYNATHADGTYPFDLKILNLNESNVCNHKCLYCNKDYSYLLDENKKIQKAYNTPDDLIKDIDSVIEGVEHIIFASGESVLQPGYYYILKKIKEKNLKIKLDFVTNFSKTSYLNYNIFEILNDHENVTLFASIDTYGKRQEYIRKNSSWDVLEDNRLKLNNYKNIKFAVHSVVSNLNIYTLPDFHMDWYNKGYLTKDNLRYLILTSPKQFHVSVMPEKLKSAVKDKYQSYMEFLKTCTDTTINQATPYNKIQAILKEMQKNEVYNLKAFQDEYYKEDFLQIFEEFNIC